MYGTDEDAGDSTEEVTFVAGLLIPGATGDELVNGGTGVVKVAGGTKLSPGLAVKSPGQLLSCHVP